MRMLRTVKTVLVIGSMLVVLGSCAFPRVDHASRLVSALRDPRSVLSDPLEGPDHAALAQTAAADAVVAYRIRPAGTVTSGRKLTIDDCRALVLANSLELQMARLEEGAQKALEYANLAKAAPHVSVMEELTQRENPAFSYSEVLGKEGVTPNPGGSGEGVNTYSMGRERVGRQLVLETRWSPTDAALAFFLTRNTRNDKSRKHYLKVRTAQRILGLVESAFPRMLALQKLLPLVGQLVSVRSDVARRTERLFHARLVSAEDLNKRQEKLVKAERILGNARIEYEHQRNLLATAMQISPEYSVDGGFCLEGELETPCLSERMADMEMIAVRNRPEAYVAGLDHINSVNDLRRTLVKYLPKVVGYWKRTRDEDIHLYNKDWKELGFIASLDVVEWYGNVWESRAARIMTDKTYRGIGAVALTITSEVRIAALKFHDAADSLKASIRSLDSSEKLLKINRTRVEKEVQQRLTLMDMEGDVLSERIETVRATGEAMARLAEVRAAMGLNYSEPLAR